MIVMKFISSRIMAKKKEHGHVRFELHHWNLFGVFSKFMYTLKNYNLSLVFNFFALSLSPAVAVTLARHTQKMQKCREHIFSFLPKSSSLLIEKINREIFFFLPSWNTFFCVLVLAIRKYILLYTSSRSFELWRGWTFKSWAW